MQFPGVIFLDMERNLDGPELFVRSKNKELSYGYVPVTFDDAGNARESFTVFDNLIAEINSLKSNPDCKFIVVDNLTMVNEYIIQKVLKEQGKKEMEARYWQPFKSNFIKLLVSALRGSGKHTICTCHESIATRPNKEDMMNPTIVGYTPAIQGGITDFFGGFFTDMWRFTSILGAGNTTNFRIQTSRDTLSDLKNSMGMPGVIEVPSGQLAWTKIQPFLKDIL